MVSVYTDGDELHSNYGDALSHMVAWRQAMQTNVGFLWTCLNLICQSVVIKGLI